MAIRGYENCWVINNKTDDCWLIDEDKTKPVYLENGMPKYDRRVMFEYRLSNQPSEKYQLEHPKEATVDNQIEGQMTIFDFMEQENEK